MRPIADLKLDMEVSRNLGEIIDVLKTAATIQFHAAQNKSRPDEIFLKGIEENFAFLQESGLRHPYLYERGNMPACVAVITSDEGFLGELNTLLVNMALDQKRSSADEFVVLGERGARYFEDVDEKFTLFPGVPDELDGNYVSGLRDYFIEGYKKRFGKITLIYPEFVSLTVQHVKKLQLLPSASPLKSSRTISRLQMESMLIEPSGGVLLRSLVELWFGFKLWEVCWSSKQSEYAARIMHLEGSTQELTQINKTLSLEYFRQVHMLRDKVIREISASKLLVGKK